MDKDLFKEYANLKIEEKRIKKQIEKLSPLVKEEMNKAGAQKVPSAFGTFTLKPVSVWKYSEAVDILEQKVDTLKESEKATGVAMSDVRYDLVFTAPKTPEDGN